MTDERKRNDDKRTCNKLGDNRDIFSIQLLADVLQSLGEQDTDIFVVILGSIDNLVVEYVQKMHIVVFSISC